MKPKLEIIKPLSRVEINKQLAVMAVRLHRMRKGFGGQVQQDLAAKRAIEFPEPTLNTQMAKLLAGKPNRWWEFWK